MLRINITKCLFPWCLHFILLGTHLANRGQNLEGGDALSLGTGPVNTRPQGKSIEMCFSKVLFSQPSSKT